VTVIDDVQMEREADFETWYRSAWPRVVRAVEVYTGDSASAPDLAADAFAKTLRRWGAPDQPRNPTSWTIAVALNAARRAHLRRSWEKERQPLVDESDGGQPEVDLDLRRAIARLPTRMRKVIVLRYVVDLPDREIAVQMGISEGTVAATLHRARARLRENLKDGSYD